MSPNSAHDIAARGWLSRTPEAFRESVLRSCILQQLDAGKMIYMVGDPPGGMYCLVKGSLRMTISPGKDGPFFAHIVRPGFWLGEGSALSGQPRQVGLVTASRSSLLYLSLPAIDAIVARLPGAWRLFGRVAVTNLQTAFGVIEDLMIRDDAKRLVAALLRLGGCRAPSPEDSQPVSVEVAQDELAGMANLARTTVGLILHRLKEAGLVDIAYRRVILLQPPKLRTMLLQDRIQSTSAAFTASGRSMGAM